LVASHRHIDIVPVTPFGTPHTDVVPPGIVPPARLPILNFGAKLLQTPGREGPTMEEARKGRFSAGPLTFAEKGKLPAMIERAGYPGVAADLDVEKPTPNLGAAD
jgi:hypothetical protein